MRDIPSNATPTPKIDKELLLEELHTIVMYTLYHYDNPSFVEAGFIDLIRNLLDGERLIYLYRDENVLAFGSDVYDILHEKSKIGTLSLETDGRYTVIPEHTLYDTIGSITLDDAEMIVEKSKTAVDAYSL